MKHLIVVAALAALSFGEAEAKPLKLLAIGNSYTFSLRSYLGDVAAQNGCELEYCLMCIGGCSFERHVRVAEAVDASPTNAPYQVASNMAAFKGVNLSSIQKVLPAEPWDVVVIQQVSSLSWRPESYEPWGDKLIARIRALAPQANIMVQKVWSYNEICPSLAAWKIGRDEMYERLSAAYDAFAGKRGLEIIPAGTAVQLYRQRAVVDAPLKDIVGRFINTGKMPDDVRSVDTIHLSQAGQYLQANVWVAKLFGSDLKKSEMKKDIAGKYDNALLRACALDAVRVVK